MSTSLLEMRGVTTRLSVGKKLVPVVENVSFEVQRGEIVGLVGESGSGKSMTARTIIGLLPRGSIRDGTIVLDGEKISADKRDLRRIRGRRVSVVFQDPRAHIDPLYRNREHIVEGLQRHRGLRSVEAAAEAIKLLASVGIADPERVLAAYPGQVSGGMLQRVLIAGALTGEPDLLIADEATTALDVTTQAEIVGLFNRLRSERGTGIIFITHDLDLAAAICDKTIVMYAGRIMEQQETTRLFESPLHPYTAALLRARPQIDSRPAKLEVIPGQSVSAYEAPTGCSFRLRCSFAIDACSQHDSVLREMEPGSATACLRVAEIRSRMHSEVIRA